VGIEPSASGCADVKNASDYPIHQMCFNLSSTPCYMSSSLSIRHQLGVIRSKCIFFSLTSLTNFYPHFALHHFPFHSPASTSSLDCYTTPRPPHHSYFGSPQIQFILLPVAAHYTSPQRPPGPLVGPVMYCHLDSLLVATQDRNRYLCFDFDHKSVNSAFCGSPVGNYVSPT
jgi:hypothetical protein